MSRPGEMLRWLGPRNLVGVLLAVVYGLPALAYPFGNDQALHWYAGSGLLSGELPYVTSISSKPIGIFVVHAIAAGLFGGAQIGIRIVELATIVLCGWLVARLLRDRDLPGADGDVGLGALVVAGVHYTFFDYWDTAHPELWEAAALLGAATVAFRDPKPVRRALATGALVGVAFMIKYPAALPGVVCAAVVGWRAITEGSGIRAVRLLIAASLFLAGAFVVIGLCVLPFAIAGELEKMWEILYTFIVHYASAAPEQQGVPRWLSPDHGGLAVAGAALLGAVGFALSRERRSRRQMALGVVIALLLFTSVAGVQAQGRYFDYHWVAAGPLLAALACYGLRHLWPRSGARALIAAAALVALAFWAGPRWGSHREFDYRQHVDNVLAYLGGLDRSVFLDPYRGMNRLDHYGPMEDVAALINERKREGDTLCVRGFATPIYQLTRLRCPSRHIVEDIVPTGLPTWPAEYRETLRRHPPTFVVTFRDRPGDLRDLAARGYHSIGTVGLFEVMERRGELPAPSSTGTPGASAPRRSVIRRNG